VFTPLPNDTAISVQTLKVLERMDLPESVAYIDLNGNSRCATDALVRCAFSDTNLHSRMPLDPAHVR
jgi:hypothetical protein